MKTVRKALGNIGIDKKKKIKNIFQDAESVENFLVPFSKFVRCWRNTNVKEIGKILASSPYVIVFGESGTEPVGIITRKELIDFMFNQNSVGEMTFLELQSINADQIMNPHVERMDVEDCDQDSILKRVVENDLEIVLIEKKEDILGLVSVEVLLRELHLNNMFFPMSYRTVSKLKIEYGI